MPKSATTPSLPSVERSVERAYDGIALREFWGLASLLFFVGALASRFVARALPDQLPLIGTLPRDPFLSVLLVPLLALIGLGLSLLADRKRGGTGRAGFLLNLCVLGLFVVFALLITTWWLLR